MRAISLIFLFVFTLNAHATSFIQPPRTEPQDCGQHFRYFFDRSMSYIPGLDENSKRVVLGQAILKDIEGARPVGPQSPIAKGYASLGKCFDLTLDDAYAVGVGTEGNFSVSLLGLRGDRSVTWNLSYSTANKLLAATCEDTVASLKRDALNALTDMNAYFADGAYSYKLPGVLRPIARTLHVTADGRFLLTKMAAGVTAPPTRAITQVCAFPILPSR